jgi:site-specific recombinase XerD
MKNTQAQSEIYKEEIFTEYLQLKKYTLKTREEIIKSVRRFVSWCEQENIPLPEAGYNDVMGYVSHCRAQQNKARTLQITVHHVKIYYNFLLNQNEAAENPCTNVTIKNVKRKILYETFTNEELEFIYRTFANTSVNGSGVTHKRNRVIVGLIIYQGLRTQELAALRVNDVNMREGKIKIESTKRTAGRELKLQAHQLYEIMDYINETRKVILSISKKQTDKLFTSTGTGERFSSMMEKIVKALQKQDERIKEIKQIRASVITNWLKVYNIRKAQYMAGHRYVSSTESYQANNMDDLKEDVNRYHPLG